MSLRRPFTVLLVLLALLSQGVTASAVTGQRGMCGLSQLGMSQGAMTDQMVAMTTAPSCDHPMPQGDNGCQQCPQCIAGHCFAWAVPVIVSVLPAIPLHGQLIPALPAHAPGDLPARIYRPPRFSA